MSRALRVAGVTLALCVAAGASAVSARWTARRATVGDRGGASLSELLRELESPEPDERRSAVKKLAGRSDDKAWRAVLAALGDPDGRVGDEAQLALPAGGVEVLGRVLGRDGLRAPDERVRARAAEALGRFRAAVPARPLAAGLSDRSDEVRRLTAWTVERLAAKGAAGFEGDPADELVPGLARRVKGDREALVRAAALSALDALAPEAAEELALDGLEDRRPEVRAAAARVLCRRREHAAETVRRLARDESPRVRAILAELQEEVGTREAAKALVVLLEAEERVRNRWTIVETLRRMSGMRYRLDPAPWRLWAERLDASWRPERGRPLAEEVPDGGTRAFAGMPLLSDRVAFLFDFSGSLWNVREDGLTRKEFADRELRRALATLPRDALFNVVPYTDRPFPFSDRLVPASERNVARAMEFFEGCRESGRGDFLEAALLALADEDVDTIVVLTDGAPTGGEVWNLDLMMPLLVERDRFARVRFDSVLVDAPPGLARRWEELSEATGGRVVKVELP